jgi:hypothetical protein
MKRQEAIKRMEIIGIDKEYIGLFKDDGVVSVWERQNAVLKAVHYDLEFYSNETLKAKIKEFENQYEALVYMVQKTWTDFGELYAFFYVSNHIDEWENVEFDLKHESDLCYVWNETYEEDSEFGYIAFKKAMGGIYRVA